MDTSERGRIPFMPFYISDFRGNPEVRAMDWFEQSLYLYILMDCWDSSDDCVSDDPVRLARQVGLPLDQFKQFWPVVRDRLVEKGPGRLTHPRIAREKARVIEKSNKMRVKMKKYWADKKAKDTATEETEG